jgi:hypothetical protein
MEPARPWIRRSAYVRPGPDGIQASHAFGPSAIVYSARTESSPVATTDSGRQRYGEAVVREILGANFIEEQPVAPRNPQRSDG